MTRKVSFIAALSVLLAAAPLLAADADQKPGLISFDPTAIVWVLLSFTIVVVVLSKGAWKHVLAGLKAREDKIRTDIKLAEEARAKAEASLKEHAAKLAGAEEQIRQMLGKATADAEKVAANIRAQTQSEIEAERDRARKEIESSKREAIRQVYEQTADLATTIAAKIIKRNLNPQDQQDLVNETLGQLQEMKK